MNGDGPRIDTARLTLRLPIQADFEGWCELMGDEVAARHLGGVQPPAAVWRGMATMAGSWALQGHGMFSVVERASGRWIGRVGPWRPHGWPGDEVGWGLVRSAWGNGYATEAARATMDWARERLGWTDIIHCIAPDNTASQAVARRLGAAPRGPGQLPAPFESAAIEIWGSRRDL
ncbi:MAG: GNAT family N-acetyltransferase [Planctomycetaceae bacterium]|nr:GNAT family N-acetyltransferase [Planctomycetaceae bacterium]